MNILILGANAAGMSFAAKHHRNNPQAKITILEKRDYISFGGCGLPYYAGGYFEDKERLFSRTPEQIIKMGIDLKINCEVTKVNKEIKQVTYLNNGNTLDVNYDKLIICTGASPIVPNFGTYDKTNVTTLTSMEDGEKLKNILAKETIQKITIIGGGFIGLEVLDSAFKLNKQVTLLERDPNILSNQYSPDIITTIEQEMINQKIILKTSCNVESIEDNDDGYIINTSLGAIKTDAIVFALGFYPNTQFINLKKLNNTAILTNQFGKTADDFIYAIGDCATIYNKILKGVVYLPLATSANKQGRMVADHLSGKEVHFKGMLGSSCLKVLDYELAVTGITEKQAIANGLKFKSKLVVDENQTDYLGYNFDIIGKIIYLEDSNQIIGCEMVGKKGVVGRINTMAVAIYSELTTNELGYLDLCYAPPFSRTWDFLNVMGNVAK